MALVNDVRKAVTAAPASASVTGVLAARPVAPSANTAVLATSAPARANQT